MSQMAGLIQFQSWPREFVRHLRYQPGARLRWTRPTPSAPGRRANTPPASVHYLEDFPRPALDVASPVGSTTSTAAAGMLRWRARRPATSGVPPQPRPGCPNAGPCRPVPDALERHKLCHCKTTEIPAVGEYRKTKTAAAMTRAGAIAPVLGGGLMVRRLDHQVVGTGSWPASNSAGRVGSGATPPRQAQERTSDHPDASTLSRSSTLDAQAGGRFQYRDVCPRRRDAVAQLSARLAWGYAAGTGRRHFRPPGRKHPASVSVCWPLSRAESGPARPAIPLTHHAGRDSEPTPRGFPAESRAIRPGQRNDGDAQAFPVRLRIADREPEPVTEMYPRPAAHWVRLGG
jgi:hypothetical protein